MRTLVVVRPAAPPPPLDRPPPPVDGPVVGPGVTVAPLMPTKTPLLGERVRAIEGSNVTTG